MLCTNPWPCPTNGIVYARLWIHNDSRFHINVKVIPVFHGTCTHFGIWHLGLKNLTAFPWASSIHIVVVVIIIITIIIIIIIIIIDQLDKMRCKGYWQLNVLVVCNMRKEQKPISLPEVSNYMIKSQIAYRASSLSSNKLTWQTGWKNSILSETINYVEFAHDNTLSLPMMKQVNSFNKPTRPLGQYASIYHLLLSFYP